MFGEGVASTTRTSSGGSPISARASPITANHSSTRVDEEGGTIVVGAADTVDEVIKRRDEDQDAHHGPRGGCCSRIFIPMVAIVLALVLFIATVVTSGGGGDATTSPRVAIFIVEGWKGTVFDELMETGVHLPNVARLMGEQGGRWARCPRATDSRCARTVTVEDDRLGSAFVYGASGIASLMSGVTPRHHRVLNDTFPSMMSYMSTSRTFPSLPRRVMEAGGGVTVLGTSKLLNSFRGTTGRCSLAGVLDVECGMDGDSALYSNGLSLECLAATSCNARVRKVKVPTDPDTYSDGHSALQFTRQLREIFGGLSLSEWGTGSVVQNPVADNLHDELLLFHFDSLAVRAASGALPDFTYDTNSPGYTAQVYLIDALIGQVLAYVRDRAAFQRENWLILGVSNHGGEGKTSAAATEDDLVVPFFAATYTNSAKGFTRLRSLTKPVSVLDLLPTAMRWLNRAPYDEATEAAAAGTNRTYQPSVDAQLRWRQTYFEGQVQAICSSGITPVDCPTEDE